MNVNRINKKFFFKLYLESENDKSIKFNVINRRTYFVIGSIDNILKNESTNKNDLRSSSRRTIKNK